MKSSTSAVGPCMPSSGPSDAAQASSARRIASVAPAAIILRSSSPRFAGPRRAARTALSPSSDSWFTRYQTARSAASSAAARSSPRVPSASARP
ncbi:hypothetical protein [Streptacidiphilus neutrinimicus]|uniref:hypothetical protein n=1 Tax=Streptacidiphilus neutrinimicus TaxID=105420 RepID=UPI0005A68E8B|nr:hypothetical protein [Streptacidiphilus neutrinimicus]